MTATHAIWTGLGGVIFLIWAAQLFRAMFQVRRIAADATGSINPGPFSTLSAWGIWLRDPERRRGKRVLIGSTILLILWVLSLPLRGATP